MSAPSLAITYQLFAHKKEASKDKINKVINFCIKYPYYLRQPYFENLQLAIIACYMFVADLVETQNSLSEEKQKMPNSYEKKKLLEFIHSKLNKFKNNFGNDEMLYEIMPSIGMPEKCPKLAEVIEILSAVCKVIDITGKTEKMYKPTFKVSRFPYVLMILNYNDCYYPIFSKQLTNLIKDTESISVKPKSQPVEQFFSGAKMFDIYAINANKEKMKKEISLEKKQMMKKISLSTFFNSCIQFYVQCQDSLRLCNRLPEKPTIEGMISAKHLETLEEFIKQYHRNVLSRCGIILKILNRVKIVFQFGNCANCTKQNLLLECFTSCPLNTKINMCFPCINSKISVTKSYKCICGKHELDVDQLSYIGLYTAFNINAKFPIYFPPHIIENVYQANQISTNADAQIDNNMQQAALQIKTNVPGLVAPAPKIRPFQPKK